MFKISASVLSANFSNLEEEMKNVSSADYIHLDVMDGHFVQNLTFGSKFIKDLRIHTKQPFDTHLMVKNPENYVKIMAEAGANIFTFHQEAVVHCDRLVREIKESNMKAGISIVPSTNENVLKYLLEDIDLVLVMTVNPGFGGQKFLVSQLKKIENIRNMIEKSNKKIELEVDGGIDEKTVQLAKNAGADVFVAGSFIFTGNRESKIKLLQKALNT
ncbi:MAG: ribulose-phosphate 3-epimerase [Rickettsiales bacterium]|jgi:ribulose-phosphate 3-epimerase|nr:ribulose-phosphate 3-epimerase [Rickettsiales bacterium]